MISAFDDGTELFAFAVVFTEPDEPEPDEEELPEEELPPVLSESADAESESAVSAVSSPPACSADVSDEALLPSTPPISVSTESEVEAESAVRAFCASTYLSTD